MYVESGTHPASGSTAKTREKAFDPELMFVECFRCGEPLLWEPGRATAMLENAGVEPAILDEHCMILSDGCPNCTRGQVFFETKVVRVHSNTPGRDLASGFDATGLSGTA